jgi:hypothetical protein
LIERTFQEAGIRLRLWNIGRARPVIPMPPSAKKLYSYAARFYLVGMYLRLERVYLPKSLVTIRVASGSLPAHEELSIEELQRWLQGSQIQSCGHSPANGLPSNVWQCWFLLPAQHGDERAVVRWTDSGETTINLEAGSYAVRRLDGTSSRVQGGDELRITEQPVLIRYRQS